MASKEELQQQLDQAEQEDQQKKERIQSAIDAREHANTYQQDSEDANHEADEAEKAINNPPK